MPATPAVARNGRMEMPSVLNIASVAIAVIRMVASLRSTLLTVAARFLRFDVVRVRGGELLEPRDQPARDEHQHEGDDQDGGDTRARLDPVHRVEPLHDLFLVIHRLLRVRGTRR